jgi:hypothetical protein
LLNLQLQALIVETRFTSSSNREEMVPEFQPRQHAGPSSSSLSPTRAFAWPGLCWTVPLLPRLLESTAVAEALTQNVVPGRTSNPCPHFRPWWRRPAWQALGIHTQEGASFVSPTGLFTPILCAHIIDHKQSGPASLLLLLSVQTMMKLRSTPYRRPS